MADSTSPVFVPGIAIYSGDWTVKSSLVTMGLNIPKLLVGNNPNRYGLFFGPTTNGIYYINIVSSFPSGIFCAVQSTGQGVRFQYPLDGGLTQIEWWAQTAAANIFVPVFELIYLPKR